MHSRPAGPVDDRQLRARGLRLAVVAVLLGGLLGGQVAPALASTTAPVTTAPVTTAPATTAPSTTAPSTAAPSTTVASDAVPHAGVAPGTVRPFAAAQGAPAGYSVGGPDVSSHNAPISWPTVAAGGSKFAYIKASESDYYTNPYYASDVAAAKANGLVVGPYGWLRPDQPNPVAQADFLLKAAGITPGAQTLPPMLDLEWGTAVGSTACYGLTPSQMSAWIHQYVGRIQQVTGRDPVIYTNTNWWNPCTGNDTSFANIPLDIAVWSSDPSPLPAGWNHWTFWQYTDNAAIGGAGVVDGNVFNGNLGDLVALASGGNHVPIGRVDSAVFSAAGVISVSGWALDPDTASSIAADVYVDGVGVRWQANQSRPDVAAAYSGAGGLHGFSGSVTVSPGPHQVCVFGIDSTGGPNTLIQCATVSNSAPVGSVDAAAFTAPGVISVSGWALDRDTPGWPVAADVYVDGVGVRWQADQSRPDIAAVYSGAGALHGFSGSVAVSPGTHTVCVFGIDSVGGANTLLQCSSVSNHVPVGSVDAAVFTAPGVISVSGWVVDPDTAAPVPADVYVDGVGVRWQADQSRPDIAAAYPGKGALHGFSGSVTVSAGAHTVCVFGIDSVNGPNTLLQCVRVSNSVPVGRVDAVAVTAPGVVSVSGWALDPDTAASIPADVYVDGVGVRWQADQSRPDIAAAYPGKGALHGFSGSVTVSAGAHTVCVFGIDSVNGPNTLLQCVRAG